jgi:hypothetical protein
MGYANCTAGDCVNGTGTMVWTGAYSGERYVGAWQNGARNGQGANTYANGDYYEGEFRDNKRHGQGTLTLVGGERYVGVWQNDARNGQGANTYANGDYYEGEFRDDKRHGQGTLTLVGGERYVGVWQNDARNGQGTNTWVNGDYYVGAWQNDARNGQGAAFDKNNNILQSGLWADDKFVRTTTQVAQLTPKAVTPLQASDTTPPTITLQRGINIVSTSRHAVKGQATDTSGVAIVEVNGQEARLDSNGNFTANILLIPGSNNVTIVAIDSRNNQASKTFSLTREQAQVAAVTRPANLTIQTGQYHALIIGVSNYRDPSVTDLEEPGKDAANIKRMLETEYTFEPKNVVMLSDPTRDQILDQFDRLSRELTEKDNLLVFYAGHGYWDEQTSQGYWLPSDASQNRRRDWIANGTVVDYMNGIKTKHTLLVADACFSGGIFKTRSAFGEPPAATNALYNLPSRKAITSGTLTEVPDKSVFVEYLIKRLGNNEDKFMSSEDLFSRFKTAVINNSPTNQIPQFGEIRAAGDEGGDFIFVRR